MRKLLQKSTWKTLFVIILMTVLSLQANNSDSLIYIWDFTSKDSKDPNIDMDYITERLTDEFEEALIKSGCYTVLERRKYDRLITHKDNERSILGIEGISSATLDSLKFYQARVVIFGNVFNDIPSDEIKVTVTFQSFSGEKLKIESIRFRRDSVGDATSREKAMEKLVEEICSEKSALKSEEGNTIPGEFRKQ